MSKIDLKGNPFFLDEVGIKWVEDTKNNMTIEETTGQLFFLMGLLPCYGAIAPAIWYNSIKSMDLRYYNYLKNIYYKNLTISQPLI